MKQILLAVAVLSVVSCSKKSDNLPAPPPSSEPTLDMEYTDLQNITVSKDQHRVLDLDKDGNNDFLFAAMLIGDPLEMQDKLRFSVYSNPNTSLLIQDPNRTPVLEKGAPIYRIGRSPFEWFIIAQAELTEKVTGMQPPSFWRGDWKDASHRFIAVQVNRAEKSYNGWIEISVDQKENRVILHKMAVSKIAEVEIRAGI